MNCTQNILLFVFITGLMMGSFLYCLAECICLNIPVKDGISKCMHCGHVLDAIDLIPVFSYFFLKGKCRYCGKELSFAYPLSQIITAILYVWIVSCYGISLETLKQLVLWSICICLVFTDFKKYYLPDELIVLGIISRLLFLAMEQEALFNILIPSLLITLPLWLITVLMEKMKKKEMMGGGDLKLIFMLTMYTTLMEGIWAIFLASAIGILMGLFYYFFKKEKIFPFGPCIILGYFIMLTYGNFIVL